MTRFINLLLAKVNIAYSINRLIDLSNINLMRMLNYPGVLKKFYKQCIIIKFYPCFETAVGLEIIVNISFSQQHILLD